MKIFSDEERRGLMVLLPLILIMVLLAVLAERRNDGPVMLGDTGHAQRRGRAESSITALSPFDPNEAGYEELRQCGVPAEVAVGIIRWRRYGKIYRIEEDMALVSGMNDSLFAELRPYIIISEKYAAAPHDKSARPVAHTNRHDGTATENGSDDDIRRTGIELTPFAIDTASAAFLVTTGFSPRQAEAVVRYREASGGTLTQEQFRRCYVVSNRMAERLLPYIIFAGQPSDAAPDEGTAETEEPIRETRMPIEINSADSATLRSVHGIGERSVTEIIRYRELLGGYCSVEQLAELKCVTESNYEKILQQIYCDTCNISKIDINFASPKEIGRHPYVSAKALRKIVKQRKLKGGWSGIEEMTEDNIFTKEEAERLAPYLRFGPCAD